jgi:2-polyprenyl-3-methyl-5-hydroxy-6-metoxy-1,4-benzoquinol methylase
MTQPNARQRELWAADGVNGEPGFAAATFEEYNEKIAASDLRRYLKKGPMPWTKALIEALKAEGIEGATLLNIGGGIGAIQHELFAAGLGGATAVEASYAYLDTARTESARRGDGSRITYRHGDFVEVAESVPRADIVTLERVLNVYPDWERLAGLSAEHAQRIYGLVVPRDTLFVRLVIAAMNRVLRLQRRRVRAAIVAIDAIDRVLREKGLVPHFSAKVGPAWQVAVYRRP